MEKLPTRFGDVLSRSAEIESRNGLLLGAMGAALPVPIPQRVFRRPVHRYQDGYRDSSPEARPPLLRLLGVRNGAADTCIRLYLWMWAVAASRGFNASTVRYTSGEWAVLLNLLAPEQVNHPRHRPRASRRAARAARILEDQGLVRREGRDDLRLLEPGTDHDYVPETPEQRAELEERREKLERRWGDRFDSRRSEAWEDSPLRIPAALWINGTISALSAQALAVLIVLLDQERLIGVDHGPPDRGDGIIRLRKSRSVEYPIPHQAWSDGTKELVALKCIWPKPGKVFYTATGDEERLNNDLRRVDWTINHRRLARADETIV